MLSNDEIKKALKDCATHNGECYNCPSETFCEKNVVENVFELTLDLINQYEAEIKSLKTENIILSQKRFNIFERIEFTDKIKAEAIKEMGVE